MIEGCSRRAAIRSFCAVLAGTAASLAGARNHVRRLGYLMPRVAPTFLDEAFLRRLRELGHAVGENLRIEYRWAGNDPERLQAYAMELARIEVDVIVTATTAGTRAAMRATSTIPIVMAATADPVGAGLIANLGRPGGNVTGVSLQTTDLARKRLQLMLEIVPGAKRVGLLAQRVADPAHGTTSILVAESKQGAQTLGLDLLVQEIGSAAELEAAFAVFKRQAVHAILVQVGPLMIENRRIITELAARERLPAMYEARNFVEAGGLVAYGPDLRESYRLAAGYVDRLFKGAKAADLPVQQPDKHALAINLAAAKALTLPIPQAVLLQADEVIP
jgi:putative ABC transport system substrate-binding protein